MRIMTSNIWGDYFGNPAPLREDAFIQTFLQYKPDVLGLQEVTAGWENSGLFKGLEREYTRIPGVDNRRNYTPLLYRTERFFLLENGWEPFVDTPDESKSISWAVLEEKDSKKRLGVCNTHFWWKPGEEHEVIREKNAAQLLARMQAMKAAYSVPIYAMGDLNSTYHQAAMRFLRINGVETSFDLARQADLVCSHHGDPARGADGRYHGARTEKDRYESIDHIVAFPSLCEILCHRVIEDTLVLDASDHSPIYVDIVL